MWKSVLLFSAAVLIALLPASVAGGLPQEPAAGKAPAKSNPEILAKAKKLYAVDCSMCHGDDGSGKTDLAKDMNLKLLDWSDPTALANKTDKDLFDIIRNGKGEKMPAEGSARAKDDEVWHLVFYIRSMAHVQPAAPTAPAAPGL
jgi:mono/diheme cytochrome c family protein